MMAMRSLRSKLFKGGTGSVWRTSLQEFEELGIGISLYFRLLKALAITFLCMAVITLPSLWVPRLMFMSLFFCRGRSPPPAFSTTAAAAPDT